MNADSMLDLLPLLAITFLVAGFVKGVAGMGLPTVAMAVLGGMLSPTVAASMLIIPSLVTNVWQSVAGGHLGALLRRLWPMLLGVVVGTTAGSVLIVTAPADWTRLALGAALIAYAVVGLLTPAWRVPPRAERWAAPATGVSSGVVAGATGVFVIPAIPYLQSLGLGRDELVQALGMSFTTATLALAIGLAGHGALGFEHLGLSTLAVLPALCGMWLGQRVRHRIPPRHFRTALLLLLFALGLELASRPFI